MTKLEALDIFVDNLDEIETSVNENWRHALLELRRPTYKNSALFRVQSWRYLYEQEQLAKKFQGTLRLIQMKRQPIKKDQITDTDILKAKEHPIENLLSDKPKRGMARCPLHNENTASFHIRKNNTFVCYGCNEYGDVLDLYQKIHHASFLEAVRKLK